MADWGVRLSKLAQFLATGGTVPDTAISTAETDITYVLRPDGAGGVAFSAEAGGGGGSGRLISRTQSVIADELFYNGSGGLYNGSFNQSISGTSAAILNATAEAGHPGVIMLSTGTTSTGRAALFQINAVGLGILLGGGVFRYGIVMKINQLSSGTQTYTLRLGTGDSVTGEFTDGVFFRYTDGVNSGKWEIVCRANNVETAADSGVTADTNWHTFEAEVNAGATSVEFFIDGASVGTTTTDIPTGAGREMVGYAAAIIKSVGSTASTITLDAYWYHWDFTTPR